MQVTLQSNVSNHLKDRQVKEQKDETGSTFIILFMKKHKLTYQTKNPRPFI